MKSSAFVALVVSALSIGCTCCPTGAPRCCPPPPCFVPPPPPPCGCPPPPCGFPAALPPARTAAPGAPAPLAKVPAEPPAPAAAPGASDPMGSPEEWAKLAAKNEHHERLAAALVGEWDVHVKMTMNGQTTESDGTSSIKPIFDGRFLEQTVQSTMMGQPFSGRGWIGYDNAKNKLVGVWIDSMGTGIETIEGDEKEPGKVWETAGTFSGPNGTVVRTRDVMKKVGPDAIHMESFMPGSDQPMMTLDYKRKS
jgi:uncharacterized protein DUF1579